MRVAVVGAGIVGLATTCELLQHGVEVRCHEAAAPMGARSGGDTRIFRFAHADPLLVELAMRSRRGWDGWEEAAGAEFIGHEGTIVSGPPAQEWARAMGEAGAPFEVVESGPLRDHLPARSAVGPFLHDPAGGVIQARRVGTFLHEQARGALVPARVQRVEPCENGASLLTDAGRWRCDSVVIAAGEGTAPLAAAAGVDVPGGMLHHARFTFTLRDPGASPACWLDHSEAWRAGFTTYSHAVGEQGQWSIGGSLDESDTHWDLGAATVIERSRMVVTRYVREYLDGVDPKVIDILYCNHTASPASGDGFGAARNGAIFAVWGDNLFKMAPLLGALLAQTARTQTIAAPLTQPIPHSS